MRKILETAGVPIGNELNDYPENENVNNSVSENDSNENLNKKDDSDDEADKGKEIQI